MGQALDLPGRDAVDEGFLNDRDQSLLRLAAPTLASASILIISVITHLSIARKGSGSVMNCNSAFLKGVL
jgi:hypothetical protein